jgi:cysteine desulfurase
VGSNGEKASRGMIYLDYQATTPLAPEVAAAMHPWIETNFGNPHSPYRIGREAAAAIEVARGHVLAALGDGSREGRLYFTSGATEAANWALKGAAADLPEERSLIVTLPTEHACVIDTAHWLEAEGRVLEILPVAADGLVDLDQATETIDERTALVAVMLVNNEIGVIQPISELSRLARERDALVFCDAAQALGRVPIPFEACDMVALSAHKVHGPKGIGALWIRNGVEIEPLLHGGGQEGGLRSGTLSPALCVGFGEAAKLIVERRDDDAAHVGKLWDIARAETQDWILNGSSERRYKGNLNLRRDGIDAARLISEVREVAFSLGSACASGSGRPSHVLAALGLSDSEARSSIRLGFGRYTSEEDLRTALRLILEAAERQRSLPA